MPIFDPKQVTTYTDGDLCKVVFLGGHIVGALTPFTDELAGWVTTFKPHQRVRTGAVSHDLAEILANNGFSYTQELVLMSKDLATPNNLLSQNHRPSLITPTQSPLKFRVAAGIDASAFAPRWSMTAKDLRVAYGSTSRAQIFFGGPPWRRNGFILVGTTQSHAYLQRLAVIPSAQQQGIGKHLVDASISWSQSQNATRMFVNTELDNGPALRLYDRIGFNRHVDKLYVMERSVQNT